MRLRPQIMVGGKTAPASRYRQGRIDKAIADLRAR